MSLGVLRIVLCYHAQAGEWVDSSTNVENNSFIQKSPVLTFRPSRITHLS
jgi:hypothetical protein